jgi:hypothetical protein
MVWDLVTKNQHGRKEPMKPSSLALTKFRSAKISLRNWRMIFRLAKMKDCLLHSKWVSSWIRYRQYLLRRMYRNHLPSSSRNLSLITYLMRRSRMRKQGSLLRMAPRINTPILCHLQSQLLRALKSNLLLRLRMTSDLRSR